MTVLSFPRAADNILDNTARKCRKGLSVRALIGEGPAAREATFTKRAAWMLRQLVLVGARGFAASQAPAGSRVSHFVYQLRHEHGLEIDCPREATSGEFGGSFGRYRLVTPVRILEIRDPKRDGE